MSETMIAPAGQVSGIARAPLPYGLFSVVGPRTGTGERWESGAEWETMVCQPAGGIGAPYCAPEDVIGIPRDEPPGGQGGEATPFTVYGHFQCSPISWSLQDAEDRARAHLLAREESRVEQALWSGDLGNMPNLTDGDGQNPTTVLAGGTAMGLPQAFALLEDAISGAYGSLGVIHLTRGAALQAVARRLIEPRNGRLFTAVGTPVVAGSGYSGLGPAGSAAPGEGESFAYATPALMAYRSEPRPLTQRPGDLLDRARNDLLAIVERSYLVGFDPCGVAAVRMKLDV